MFSVRQVAGVFILTLVLYVALGVLAWYNLMIRATPLVLPNTFVFGVLAGVFICQIPKLIRML